jgi:NADH-quinone oxidoreductase subunit H
MSLAEAGTVVGIVLAIITLTMLHVAYAVYFERKVVAHMQARLGPTRVGPHGLLQPIADGVKLFFKEDLIPSTADKSIFFIAPVISAFAALASLAVVPFTDSFAIAHINIGLLYILALSSLGAYGVILGGWSSNSKYSFLGSLRSAAQVISYEIAMGLSLIGVILLAGSTDLATIVRAQADYPFVIPQFLGFFVFLMAAIAETNRLPFDLPEAETELVAGYFTEYTGFRFSLFFVAEYAGMFVMSALATVCFLGGWHGPEFWIFAKVPPVIWFMLKVYGLIFFYFWIRATLPRYRYDQLMGLGWKVFIPLAMFNVGVTGLLRALWL